MPAASSYSWCLQSAGEFQNGLECMKAWLFFLDMKCHTWFTYKISYSATNYSVLYLGEFVLAHHALVQLTIHLLHSSQTLKLPSWMLQTISICLSGLSETQMAIEYFKGESIFLTFWTKANLLWRCRDFVKMPDKTSVCVTDDIEHRESIYYTAYFPCTLCK